MLGPLMGYIGAGAGLLLIYTIPTLVNMVYYKNKHPDKLSLLQEQLDNYESDPESNSPEETRRKYKPIQNTIFYTLNILIIAFGLFTITIQFVPINFFNIHLK
jgi:hypothetical protein